MNTCRNCQKKTGGVLTTNPEDGQVYFIPELCSRCILKLNDEMLEDMTDEESLDLLKGGYTCKVCKEKVWGLRNYACMDCYLESLEAVDKLPDFVEPLEPPLGYNFLFDLPFADARYEVDQAYALTPQHGELEN